MSTTTTLRPDLAIPALEFISVLSNPQHHRSNRDLNKLSIKDRKRVFQDLAGSSELVEENLHELADGIRQMQVETNNITGKHALELACQMDPEYASDPGFQLMFLRANDYDPKRAAEQLINHFEEKLSLFGHDKLTRDIELSDLTPDDLYSLSSGGIQISNTKDQAGRTVIFFRYTQYRFKQRENWYRASWYLMMAALEDEEAQKRGVVTVAYEVGDAQPLIDFELIRREMSKMNCIPLRVAGAHFCTSQPQLMKALDLMIHFSTPFFRVRLRAHYGIETEILYQLMTFGIPVYSVPWVCGGDNNHKRWLEERRALETGEGMMMDYSKDGHYDYKDGY